MEFENFGNGAVREDKTGKGRLDLIPWCAIMRVAKHMEESLKVYSPRNWEQGLPMHSMMDSAFRHLAKYMDGWDDEDHLCAAATNLLMAMWMEEHRPEMQDIPSRTHGNTSSLHSDDVSVVSPACESGVQEKAKEERSVADATCRYYRAKDGMCTGESTPTKCLCNGSLYRCEGIIL